MHLNLNNGKWSRLAAPKTSVAVVPSSTAQTRPKRPMQLDVVASERLKILAQPKFAHPRTVQQPIIVCPKRIIKPQASSPEFKTNSKKGILKKTGEPVYIQPKSLANQRRQIWLDLMAKPKCINIDSNPDYERIVHRKPNKTRLNQLARPKHWRMNSAVSPSFSF